MMRYANRITQINVGLTALVVGLTVTCGHTEMAETKVSAAGWIQYGQVHNSSDTLSRDHYDHQGMQAYGALISLSSNLSDKLSATAGLGVGAGHFLIGRIDNNGGYSPLMVGPFVSEADFVYHFWDATESKLNLKIGYFPYNYNPLVKNLGLYLLRGPVYPGIVMSGFDLKPSSVLGLMAHHQSGNFEQNFIVNSETEIYPYFDISFAYVANYKVGAGFEVGFGVNLYHYLPIDNELTSHDSSDWEKVRSPKHPFERTWFYADTAAGSTDTTYLSFKGTKVMVKASWDMKEVFTGFSKSMGDQDLILYSEVALLGLRNDKPYQKLYGGYAERMPVMVGFNFPTFNFMDHLSLEVEWYGAKFRDDMIRFQHSTTAKQSPIPVSWPTDANPQSITKDNVKWSLNIAKTIQDHVQISAQAASDHFRPGIYEGLGDNNPPRQEALLLKPSDWYWMAKVAYFF